MEKGAQGFVYIDDTGRLCILTEHGWLGIEEGKLGYVQADAEPLAH